MIGYGFGYDEELPRGFQDADLEMRELEDRANEARICPDCGNVRRLYPEGYECAHCNLKPKWDEAAEHDNDLRTNSQMEFERELERESREEQTRDETLGR